MTNRKMEKKLRRAFARLTPAQAGSEQPQTLHTNPQIPEPEMPMKLPKSRLAFPTIAAVAAILAVVIFVGGPLLLGPSVSSGNDQPNVKPSNSILPNITPPNGTEPDLFSAESMQEIVMAWEKQYGTEIVWDVNARYYGIYGDGFVALFHGDEAAIQVIESEEIDTYTFTYSTPFELLIYRDGTFVPMEYACAQGMITKEDVAAILAQHMMHPGTPEWAREEMKAANLIPQNIALEYARNKALELFTDIKIPKDYLDTPMTLTIQGNTLAYKFTFDCQTSVLGFTLNAFTGELLDLTGEDSDIYPTTPPDGKLDRDTAIEKALAYAGLTKEQALITVGEVFDRYNITLTTDTKEYYLEIGMYDSGALHEFDVKYFNPDDYNPDATEGPNLPPPTSPATPHFDEKMALSCALKYASWKLDDQLTIDDLTNFQINYQILFDHEDWHYDVVLVLDDIKYCFEIDGNTGYAISVEVNYVVADHDIGFLMYTKPEAIDIALKDRGVSESDVTHLACYETEDIYYVVSFIYKGWEYVYNISGRAGSILSIEADSEYVLYG